MSCSLKNNFKQPWPNSRHRPSTGFKTSNATHNFSPINSRKSSLCLPDRFLYLIRVARRSQRGSSRSDRLCSAAARDTITPREFRLIYHRVSPRLESAPAGLSLQLIIQLVDFRTVAQLYSDSTEFIEFLWGFVLYESINGLQVITFREKKLILAKYFNLSEKKNRCTYVWIIWSITGRNCDRSN